MERFYYYIGWMMIVGVTSFFTLGLVTLCVVERIRDGRYISAIVLFSIFTFLAILTVYIAYLFGIGKVKGYLLDIITIY
ncbi:MAG: hypothetical protein ACUVWP_07120 [bacterium]